MSKQAIYRHCSFPTFWLNECKHFNICWQLRIFNICIIIHNTLVKYNNSKLYEEIFGDMLVGVSVCRQAGAICSLQGPLSNQSVNRGGVWLISPTPPLFVLSFPRLMLWVIRQINTVPYSSPTISPPPHQSIKSQDIISHLSTGGVTCSYQASLSSLSVAAHHTHV